jgi:hypothetical protein
VPGASLRLGVRADSEPGCGGLLLRSMNQIFQFTGKPASSIMSAILVSRTRMTRTVTVTVD